MYYETIQIDFNSDEAIYIQLRIRLFWVLPLPEFRKEILYLRQDSSQTISESNMHTVNKAYSVLRQEGFFD